MRKLFGETLYVPTTWREPDQQMAFFHDPQNGRYGGSLFRTEGYVAWEWWIRLHANGVWPLSTEMIPQIAGDAGIVALDAMIDSNAHTCPDIWHLGLFENWARYSRGDIYCCIGWGGTQKFLGRPTSKIKNRVVFGPTHGGHTGDGLLSTLYFNWGCNCVVTTTCTRSELAYFFCLFAASPAISTLAIRQSKRFFDPFRLEHYVDDGIKQIYSSAFLDVQRASLVDAIPDFYLRGHAEYFRVLNQELMQALTGEKAPKQALGEISESWELLTSRFGRPAQIERWLVLRAKYPARAQLLLRDTV